MAGRRKKLNDNELILFWTVLEPCQ